MAKQEEPTYTRWRIEIKLYDERMKQLDAFTTRQDLLLGQGVFAVRLS